MLKLRSLAEAATALGSGRRSWRVGSQGHQYFWGPHPAVVLLSLTRRRALGELGLASPSLPLHLGHSGSPERAPSAWREATVPPAASGLWPPAVLCYNKVEAVTHPSQRGDIERTPAWELLREQSSPPHPPAPALKKRIPKLNGRKERKPPPQNHSTRSQSSDSIAPSSSHQTKNPGRQC